jgi:SHS2 domain-containing protein
MPYRFLEETAIADVAFEAAGKTLPELFESAALAVTATMVGNLDEIRQTITKRFTVEAENVEMLLFNFLQDLIFYKDAEQLLFGGFDLAVEQRGNKWYLGAKVSGEKIDPNRHELVVDVKAVSLHHYRVEETSEGWQADVILDV